MNFNLRLIKKAARNFFCIAALLIVAKPFLGFTIFSRLHPPSESNIFIKVFNKRKLEYAEDSIYDQNVILKNLSHPDLNLFFRFSYFLSILFPLAFGLVRQVSQALLNKHRNSFPFAPSYLLNSTLLI